MGSTTTSTVFVQVIAMAYYVALAMITAVMLLALFVTEQLRKGAHAA